MKVSIVNSTGGSLCCNYAPDLFIYAKGNVYCIFAGFQVLLSVTGMLVDLSVTIMQVAVSVAVMQLEVSAAHMQVTFSPANMCLTVFIVIVQIGVSVVIMQVVFSVVHYAHDCVYCNSLSNSCQHSANVNAIADVKSKIMVSHWYFFADMIYSAT